MVHVVVFMFADALLFFALTKFLLLILGPHVCKQFVYDGPPFVPYPIPDSNQLPMDL